MSTNHTRRKQKPAFSRSSPFSCGNTLWHFSNLTKLDHSVLCLDHLIFQVTTSRSETWAAAESYCVGKPSFHFMFFFLSFSHFFVAKGPSKSCPLYLRPGVHRLTAGWEDSMMGKTWWDLTLVGRREGESEREKRSNQNEGLWSR